MSVILKVENLRTQFNIDSGLVNKLEGEVPSPIDPPSGWLSTHVAT